MKKTIFYIIAILFIMIFAVLFLRHNDFFYRFQWKKGANSIEKKLSEPVLAVFSFQPGAINKTLDSFRHYKLIIKDDDDWNSKRKEITELNDTIPLMITVETWSVNNASLLFNNPLKDLLDGKFDTVIKQFCTQLIGTRPNVYLRFDPEMEVPVKRFPWQYFGGDSYIDAFRHFTSLCKTFAPQVKQVWGPAGYPGTLEYYPGDDVVDAASVSLKSDSEIQLDVYPKDYPVSYDLMRRLHRLRFIDKPIYILGSPQIVADSVNNQLVSFVTTKISQERDVVYSTENFNRTKIQDKYIHSNKFEIGLYDPQSLLNKEKPVTVEHLFADFGNIHDGTFQINFKQVVERNHDVIVTFEPFRNPNGVTDLQVLKHVDEGMYDKEINHLYDIILSTKRQVYLRYAHEMEIPITRYPWQSQDPVTYIKSYRYFMTFIDSLPPTIKRVWGPAGDRGSIEWYPGNDVVDFISIAIYGLPDKNITDPEKQESFSTIFDRKYWRLRFVDKPLFITEFGVKGPEEYQTKWLEAAAKVIRENPRIKGINYFNMSDTPKAWGDIKPPDWSITKKSFYRFVEVLNE